MGLDSTQSPPKSYLFYLEVEYKQAQAGVYFFIFHHCFIFFSHGIVGMVASIPCDQGTHGQKIIPERWTVWGDMEDHSCFMYISKGKGGALDIVSAAVIGGRSSPGWHGAWRWVVIFSYFHLGLVDGDVLAECAMEMERCILGS
ncbi:hypothetical protein GGI35DRAFT_335682 [Trichoderma velutinum]